jgi:hypothetical protein
VAPLPAVGTPEQGEEHAAEVADEDEQSDTENGAGSQTVMKCRPQLLEEAAALEVMKFCSWVVYDGDDASRLIQKLSCTSPASDSRDMRTWKVVSSTGD